MAAPYRDATAVARERTEVPVQVAAARGSRAEAITQREGRER